MLIIVYVNHASIGFVAAGKNLGEEMRLLVTFFCFTSVQIGAM
jgi:hypothetical protein